MSNFERNSSTSRNSNQGDRPHRWGAVQADNWPSGSERCIRIPKTFSWFSSAVKGRPSQDWPTWPSDDRQSEELTDWPSDSEDGPPESTGSSSGWRQCAKASEKVWEFVSKMFRGFLALELVGLITELVVVPLPVVVSNVVERLLPIDDASKAQLMPGLSLLLWGGLLRGMIYFRIRGMRFAAVANVAIALKLTELMSQLMSPIAPTPTNLVLSTKVTVGILILAFLVTYLELRRVLKNAGYTDRELSPASWPSVVVSSISDFKTFVVKGILRAIAWCCWHTMDTEEEELPH